MYSSSDICHVNTYGQDQGAGSLLPSLIRKYNIDKGIKHEETLGGSFFFSAVARNQSRK